MRWSPAVALVLIATGAAAADPVNLLRAAPSVVAVSSSVANAAILPEHLVDGDLGTAWNSRTEDLAGAWIAVRVPTDAHVTAIRLTAGFTRATKRDGDLFTMNPRITKVRVSRAGKTLGDFALDPAVRTLQELPLDAPGGDFRIDVVDILPGSKTTWREASVSELEVWGTLAGAAVASTPVVRIGSLDAEPAPGFGECQKLLLPDARGGRVSAEADADWITSWDALGVGHGLAVCRIEHRAEGSHDTTVELGAVQLAKRWALTGRQALTTTTSRSAPDAMPAFVDGDVSVRRFPLTQTETGVLIEASRSESGVMDSSHHTSSTLARLTATGFTPILAFESSASGGESSDADICKLQPIDPLRAGFAPLTLACTHTIGRWHGEDPRGNGEYSDDTSRHYRWDGTRYLEKK